MLVRLAGISSSESVLRVKKLRGVHGGTLSSQIQVWCLVGTRILTTSFIAV